MRIIGKEELLNDIKEIKVNIDFVETHCTKMYNGRPKTNVLKSYRMKLITMNKKLALMA